MPYPPYPARVTNFVQAADAGLESPAPAGVDSELNNLINIINQLVLRHRAITTVGGALQNVAAATAQALAGTQDITATAAQTVFTTTIEWAAFSSSNVFVFVNNVKLATTAVAVADAGGFLQVTIPAQAAGNIVTVAAFESGAGLLTKLQTISATAGASLIAINDAGGLYTAVQVEEALQEVKLALNAFIAAVGPTADLIKRTGAVAFTANQPLGGNRLTGVGDGIDPQDAVTVSQFNAFTTVWNALEAYFLRLDGSTPMASSLPMGNNKITGLLAGTAPQDGVNFTQLDTKVNKAGDTMTGPLNMGSQLITNLANPTAETDAINLQTARTIAAAFATRAQFAAAGTFAFIVPAGVTRLKARAWAGGGGGTGVGDNTQGYGGGGGGYGEAVLTVTPGETLTIAVGAGGGVNDTGGDTTISRLATALITCGGGLRGGLTGTGGVVTFDPSVVGFGIQGGGGGAHFRQAGNGDTIMQAAGGDSPQGGQGGRGGNLGSAGTAPGGGGSGTWGGGASGAAGRVELEY